MLREEAVEEWGQEKQPSRDLIPLLIISIGDLSRLSGPPYKDLRTCPHPHIHHRELLPEHYLYA